MERIFKMKEKSNKVAIILAGGLGRRCGGIVKGFLKIKNETLIHRQIRLLKSLGIRDICVVTGKFDARLKQGIKGVTFAFNPEFKKENSLSLKVGIKTVGFHRDIILIMGDTIWDKSVLKKVINSKESNYLVAPHKISSSDLGVDTHKGELVGFNVDSSYGDTGLIHLSKKILPFLYADLDGIKSCGFYFVKYSFSTAVMSKESKWYEIDTLKDYKRAQVLFESRIEMDTKVKAKELIELMKDMHFEGFHLDKRSLKLESKALKNVTSFSIRHNKKLIGYARVSGDKTFYWSIWDVIVHPEYQGLGLGRLLVDEIVKWIKKRQFIKIFLFSAKGKEHFYSTFGFNKAKAEVMEIRND